MLLFKLRGDDIQKAVLYAEWFPWGIEEFEDASCEGMNLCLIWSFKCIVESCVAAGDLFVWIPVRKSGWFVF